MNVEQIKVLMMEIPLFDQLTPDERSLLAGYIEYSVIKKGTQVIKEGALGTNLLYIVSGKMEIKKESIDGRQAVISQFGKGSIVGELALLENESRRSASANAVEDCEILSLPRKNFDEILKTNPNIGIVVLRGIGCTLANRLRNITGRFADIFN